MNLLDAIQRAHSVERFRDHRLQREDIISLIDSGRLASSYNNQQVLRYIAIRQEDTISKLLPSLDYHNQKALPNLIVVTGPIGSGHNTYIDFGAALQNMILFATSQKWGIQHIAHFEEQTIRQHINLDKERKIIAILAIGQAESFSMREAISSSESTKPYKKDKHTHHPILSTKYLISWHE